MTKTLTLLVGLPGCGKSFHVWQHEKPAFVYSTDTLIEKYSRKKGLTYDEGFSLFVKRAHKEMDQLLEQAYEQGNDIIWDQTNLTRKKRKKIIDQAKQNGYKIIGEVFEANSYTQEQELRGRQINRRGKTIPRHVLETMEKSYEVPSFDEGYDLLKFYDIFQNLTMEIGVDD